MADAPINFTARQREAVEHEHGTVEVLAGPGTGKTRILVERMARLIEKQLAWKYDILCLTFTQKDAAELRERIQLRLGEDVDKLPIYTLHGFGRNLLASERDSTDKPFRVFDPEASFRLIQRAMQDLQVSETIWSPRFVAELIAETKERSVCPEEFLTIPDSVNQQAVARVYARYQELLTEQGGYDLSDLIMATTRLLESRPELVAQIHQQHSFIQIDEWQDVSLGQYRLIRLLTGPPANLFVVGSEAQAIYEWRQANYKRLSESFYTDFPDAHLIILEENFRSRRQIVETSKAIFLGGTNYRDIHLAATRGEGERVQDLRVPTGVDEAVFVISETKRLHDEGGVPWREIAVLFRTNRQSRAFEQECLFQQVPYILLQGQRLYNRREIQDMLIYLDVVHSGSDARLASIINSPPRGLGPNTVRAIKGNSLAITWDHIFEALNSGESKGLRPKAVESLASFYDLLMDFTAHSGDRPAALIDYIFEKSGYRAWVAQDLESEAKIASIEALKADAAEYESVGEFLEAVSKKTSLEHEDYADDGDGVILSTIHTVKGLQFDVVFIVGMEEGLLPHGKAVASDEEGERRLAYVAMTRARDLLYLVSAAARERNGRAVGSRPSRYLDLPPEFINRRRL